MNDAAHWIYRAERAGRRMHVLHAGGDWNELEGDLFGRYAAGAPVDPADLRILAPLEPSKVVAVGLNYRDHAREMNKVLPSEPLIFLKPPSAVVGPDGAIVLPAGAGRVDYEAELGVVIGRRARGIAAADAPDYILGLTCVNDVTDRDL